MNLDEKPRAIHVGTQAFYEALLIQNIKAVQIEWQVPPEHSEEIDALLDEFL
ncbi:hypothetical protein AGMMS49992_11030 [Clostridia bacterium]|nr:hypothetical protein AGMMS49992_11030 [Clostridia bacterium]